MAIWKEVMKWRLMYTVAGGATLSVLSAREARNELQLNAYTKEGELAQIAFASRGVAKSSPAVGFVLHNGVGVLLSCVPRQSLLAERPGTGMEWQDNVGICPVGWQSDCLRLKSEWRDVVEQHRFRFGEAPSLDKIATRLSSLLTRGLYPERSDAFARPLATSVLFIAGGSKLVLLDSSGSLYQCHSLACLGTISSSRSEMDAVEALIFGHEHSDKQQEQPQPKPLRTIVTSVAGKLFEHVKNKQGGDAPDDGTIDVDFECCICKEGVGRVFVAKSVEEIDAMMMTMISNDI